MNRSDDVIYRQDAIDALNDVSEHYTEKGGEWHPHVNFMIDAIKEVPSAQPDWELFDLITRAYYGKMMYAKQDHGLVYSRYSGKYMTMDDAVREFVRMLSWEGEEDETD